MTARHGYMDSIVTPDLGRVIVEHLILFRTRDRTSSASSASSVEHSPEVQAEVDAVSKGAGAQLVYIMGKEQMKIKQGTNFLRKTLLWLFLWIRENSRTKMADLNIPFDNLVEVGFVKEI
jgi:KUP system potassium uptake protein